LVEGGNVLLLDRNGLEVLLFNLFEGFELLLVVLEFSFDLAGGFAALVEVYGVAFLLLRLNFEVLLQFFLLLALLL